MACFFALSEMAASLRVEAVVYVLHMLTERLQLLLTREHRARLDAEAKRSGKPIGELVRNAIDAQYGGVRREDRLRAVAEMREAAKGSGGEPPSPERLNQMIEEEHSQRP